MAEQKGLGSKLIGLFVETEGKPEGEAPSDEKSAADLIAEIAGQTVPPGQAVPPGLAAKRPTPGAPAKPAEPLPPGLKLDKVPPPPSGAIDFEAIFKEAGMDAAELDRVKKAEDLLKSLPEATPLA